MNYLWKIVRAILFGVGVLLIFGAIGTSDYYLLELHQPEPTSVRSTIIFGIVLMIPTFIHLIYEALKEKTR